jgi:hypothetical protein
MKKLTLRRIKMKQFFKRSVLCLVLFSILFSWGTNLYPRTGIVEKQGYSLKDNDGFLLGLGITYFPALYHAEHDWSTFTTNIDAMAGAGFEYVRILSMVDWRDLSSPIHIIPGSTGYWSTFREVVNYIYDKGMRTQITIFADAQKIDGFKTKEEQEIHIDNIYNEVVKDREQKIILIEIANEYWKNGIANEVDLRELGSQMSGKTPVLVALSSPQQLDLLDDLYNGSTADIATMHYPRIEGWESVYNSWDGMNILSSLPISSNEPIGPGSSVNQETDEIKLVMAAVYAWAGKMPMYVFHSSTGVGYKANLTDFWNLDAFNNFKNAKALLPGDLPNWSRNDGTGGNAPFNVHEDSEGTVVKLYGATRDGNFYVLPIGISGTVMLRANKNIALIEVFDPLTGEKLDTAIDIPQYGTYTLPSGHKALIISGLSAPTWINITSPTIGDNPSLYSNCMVEWTSDSYVDNLIMYLYKDGVNLGKVYESVSNDGNKTWYIDKLNDGTAISPGSNYQVELVYEKDTGVKDKSETFDIDPGGVSVTVTSPSGGLSWIVGTSHNLTWSTTGTVDNVMIMYSTTGYGGPFTVVTPSTPDDGSYTWVVPNIPTSEGCIRISDTVTGVYGKNQGLFSIIPPTVTVTSPNGGENWTMGTSHTLTWSTAGAIANVKIMYSTTGYGGPFTTITSSTPDDGSYSWVVPNISTTDAWIRISDTATGVYDKNNSAFSIISPTVTVTVPNGGENWTVGSSYHIKWSTTGAIANVKIMYSTTGYGGPFTTITSSTPNDGKYTWVVPNKLTTNAWIRISDTATGIYDKNNAKFSIVAAVPPTVTVTSPNGGESWTVGSSRTLKWSTTGPINNVKIMYSTTGYGGPFTTITSSTPNDGSYTWVIPNIPTANAWIRISDTASGVYDKNNSAFSIVQ